MDAGELNVSAGHERYVDVAAVCNETAGVKSVEFRHGKQLKDAVHRYGWMTVFKRDDGRPDIPCTAAGIGRKLLRVFNSQDEVIGTVRVIARRIVVEVERR